MHIDKPEQAAGLVLVLALHAAALWGLWQHRLIPTADEAATLFVNFIAPPAPERKEAPKPPPPKPKPKPVKKPEPRQIVAETPVVAPTEYVAPPPPPEPAPVVAAPPPPAAPAMPVGPVRLGSELSVACPERTPPRYPPLSRRMGEEGAVVLRVELDEQGRIGVARVSTSSGFSRLDDAALAAVNTWRCTPAQRNGQPVRAVAVQAFNFVLQGN